MMIPQVLVSLTALLLIFLFTIPSFYNIARRLFQVRRHEKPQLASQSYEDEDGVAAEEAEKANCAAIPKYVALTSTVIGLAVNIAADVYSEVQSALATHSDHWFAFGNWALLTVQIVYITTENNSIKRFNHALLAALTSAVLCATVVAREVLHFKKADRFRSDLVFALNAVQLLAGLVSLLSCLSIRRRPSLVLENCAVDGQNCAVDGQYTVSALSRFTFAWAGEPLKLARTTSMLSLEAIPKLHLRARAAFLEQKVSGLRKDKDHLVKTLLLVHGPTLAFQTCLTIGSSILHLTPQVIMLVLLRFLEETSDVSGSNTAGWALVLALGLSIVMSSWSETLIYWMFVSRLGLLLRTELAAMIFSKATRRKDVKGASSQDEEVPEATNSVTNGTQGSSEVGAGVSSFTEEDVQKSRQGTINLVGVDTKRVADFVAYSFIFPWTTTQMIVSVVFLIQLIGWKSLLSGFAIFIIVLPLNIITSKKYTDAEDSLMKIRDKKLVIITEALQGIRQIKFSAQEQQWQKKIWNVRIEELAIQWWAFTLDTCLIAIWILGPVMLSAISLAVYAYLHGNLSASVAFTSISVFGSLEMTFAVIPELVSEGLEAFVSLKRIDEYLKAPENEDSEVPSEAIFFQDASIAWPSDKISEGEGNFLLRNVNLHFPMKELTVISGATGSGKSLLLAAIIGEADQIGGVMGRPVPPASKDRYDYRANKTDWILDSAIAFVAQMPWIENATIMENILFGLPFDNGRYKKVLKCCALEKDLQILPDGDQTDIGANGINLSGGQRWRVSFARALYSRAGILVLDDIFSAVDAHVGRQLFEEALTGELGHGRTRILVTHHVGLCLPKAKYGIVLADGTVQYAGAPHEAEMMRIPNEERENLSHRQQELRHGSTERHATEQGERKILSHQQQEQRHGFTERHTTEQEDREILQQVRSNVSHKLTRIDDGELDTQGKMQPKKFTEEEKRETGSVKFAIYREYLNSSGGMWIWVPILSIFAVCEGLVIGRSWLITIWTRSYQSHPSSLAQQYHKSFVAPFMTTYVGELDTDSNLTYYLSIYIGLSVVICLMGTVRYLLVYLASLRAGMKLFEEIIYAILRAPLRWLDTVPVGRILNRLTSDFNLVDSKLGSDVGGLLYQVIQLIGIILASFFVSPWMVLSALVLLILCGRVTSYYLTGAREFKRLDSNAKSPILEQFGSAMLGIGTIRAYGKSEVYIDKMFDKIDGYTRTSWHLHLFNRWLIWRLEMVGAVFTILITAMIVHARIEASLAGFALSFALNYSSALIWSAKEYADVELAMNAVERVSEYAKIPIEDQSERTPVPAAWPTEGRLEVHDLVVGYAPDLPPVLKGLSFNVDKNQRVGVIGRTGAGKSSLTLALFRFLEPRSGSIHIDGIDIGTIALSALRGRLAIIPQDPVLFSGTVRSNLDPFDNHSDAELRDALERVHLIRSPNSTGTASRDEPTTASTPTSGSEAPTLTDTPAINTNKNVFSSLSSGISEGGLNLSQGQRQLLCLARAIVSRPKLMILDEATSAVDMATDALIQRSIREEFQDATLIVIAHRLSTIADFERVLVMDEGRGVEYDSPHKLMEKDGGVFRSMVEQSGEVDVLRRIIIHGAGTA